MNLRNRIKAMQRWLANRRPRPERIEEMTDAELNAIIADGLGIRPEQVEAMTDEELDALENDRQGGEQAHRRRRRPW
jgi:hypothetical protein